ncbi:TolC family protein [Pseudomonas putida]|uniref:TolC family protein n=1 Tax=Pseudomonas putida TaxID=303 RepID=UPI00300ECD66
MQPTIKKTVSADRHTWHKSTLQMALAGGLLLMSLTTYAQSAKDIVLTPADSAPAKMTPSSSSNMPKGVSPKQVTLAAVDDALPATRQHSMPSARKVANNQAIQQAPGAQNETPVSAKAPGQSRGTVHFSEWVKDNPDALRLQSKGSVPEGEIRSVLVTALQQAIERSPLLRQSQAEQRAAAADVREAEGQRWPQIDVGANTRGRSMGGGDTTANSSQAVSLNMTTNVFDWGRTRNTIDSRKELNTAAEQKYLASLETLASDVSLSLVDLEKARRINVISQQYVDRMSALVDMLKEIVSVDRGRASELTQAKARLMEAQAGRDSAQARVRDIQIKLRKLLGDTPVQLPQDGDWALSTANLDTLLVAAQEHPALRQADAEANASERHAAALRAGEKPQLNWVVSKSTGEDELGRQQAWQTMVTMSWPIFRGGSSRAAREAASMRAEAERERKSQQQLDLEFETRAADQDAKTLLARAELYRGLTSETDSVRKAFFEQWYHLGRRTLLDVLIAESDHNNNRVSEVTNRFDGYGAILKAYSSAGQLTQWMNGGANQY